MSQMVIPERLSPVETKGSLDKYRTLVLNADYLPMSYNPLLVWPWQQAMKLIYEDVVDPVRYHEGIYANSAHAQHPVPSVVALRTYVPPATRVPFTKYNVFLRDLFTCQYCSGNFRHRTSELTFDHVVPHARGGKTTWTNILTACKRCNEMKDCRTPSEAKMRPIRDAYEPQVYEMQAKARKFPPHHLHESWADFLYWDVELET